MKEIRDSIISSINLQQEEVDNLEEAIQLLYQEALAKQYWIDIDEKKLAKVCIDIGKLVDRQRRLYKLLEAERKIQ